MRVNAQVFVVTGGGNGIGCEGVLGLLRRGARVAAVDLSQERLAETAAPCAEAPEALSLHTVNVTDAEAVASLPAEVIERHGQVDGVHNVAGIIQPFVHFEELAPAQIGRVLSVNFWGVVNMVRAFLPELTARPGPRS